MDNVDLAKVEALFDKAAYLHPSASYYGGAATFLDIYGAASSSDYSLRNAAEHPLVKYLVEAADSEVADEDLNSPDPSEAVAAAIIGLHFGPEYVTKTFAAS